MGGQTFNFPQTCSWQWCVSACLDLSGSLGHFRIRWTGQKKLPGQHLECLPKSQLSVKLTFRETFLGLSMSPTDSFSIIRI